MSLIPPKVDTTEYQLLPVGQHNAVLTMICDLGMQPGFNPGDAEKHQVYIRWTTDLQMPDSQFNYSLGQFYTLSLHEKANLRKMLEQWRGKQFTDAEIGKFDVCSLIGKSCTLMVTHVPKQNGEMRTKLAGIASFAGGVNQPDTLIIYDQNDANEQEVFATLPEWLQNKISRTPVPPVPAPAQTQDFNDDIPF